MSRKSVLIIFVIIYSGVVIVVHDACPYPDFVQSQGGERVWRGHMQSKAGDTPAEYSVSFDGLLMRVVASNVSFQRRCTLKVGNRTYLAAQRDIVVTTDRAPRIRYLCMEFVRRSDAVLQLRTSRLASRMDPHLCAENQLMLDDRPLVDHGHRGRSAAGSGCQLTGGYDIHLYDRRRHRGLCDALDAETRLEAACGGDDSFIHFRFRYDFCVPTGLSMRADQVARCAATWTNDNDVFTVLVASAADNEDRLHAWCLRRPRRTFGRPFTAILFGQLVCDESPVAELADALMVDMQLSEDWGSSLCEDDYEGCSWDHPAKCTRAADCARTCYMCNDFSPTNCFFSTALDGRWQSPDGAMSLNVELSSLMLTVADRSGRARSTNYDCVEWRQERRSSDIAKFAKHSVDEHLVVTRPGGGCRPRYACVQFQYYATGNDDHLPSVIYFRISASRPWPIYDRLDCSSFQYVSLQWSASEVDQRYTVLTSVMTNSTRGHRDYVSCVTTSLPVATRFVVEFENDEQRRCSARIEPPPKPAEVDIYFRLISDGCWKKNVALDVRCLDRVTLSSTGAVLLLTESSPFLPWRLDADSVFCWLFTDNDTFYLLSAADCDPLTSLKRLKDKVIHPIAVFVDALTVTSTTVAATATTSVLISPSFAENNNLTQHGSSDDIVAPDVANNATSPAPDLSTATATSLPKCDSSLATLNHTRHDFAAQQPSVVDANDDSDIGSRGHGDRSHAEMSYAHVTNSAAAAAAATTTVVIAVDALILLAPIVLVGICVRSREPSVTDTWRCG